MDVARSQLSRMEAGISTDAQEDAASTGLRVESRMEPSDFPGLALAVVEVYDEQPQIDNDLNTNDPPRIAVLRQLMRGDGGGGSERPEVSR
jgi:hypothetical protein